MHARHQPQRPRAPYRFRNLALVPRPQTRDLRMLDPPVVRHKLGHERHVLPLLDRVEREQVERVVLRRLIQRDPRPVLLLLLVGQVVRRVHVPGLEAALELPVEIAGAKGGGHGVGGGLLGGKAASSVAGGSGGS
jgi:hypothetical protein